MIYPSLKNLLVGFIISFVGSIPLGYLNIIGLEIYTKNNFFSLNQFLLGIVCIELIVISLTLKWASILAINHKLKKSITLFNIFFLFVLTISFYQGTTTTSSNNPNTTELFTYNAFFMGLGLSLLNFSQLPFWFSWNLYLVNQKYIQTSTKLKPFYLFGTILGTYCGMLVFTLGIHNLFIHTKSNVSITQYLWLAFAGLLLFQCFTFFKQLKSQ